MLTSFTAPAAAARAAGGRGRPDPPHPAPPRVPTPGPALPGGGGRGQRPRAGMEVDGAGPPAGAAAAPGGSRSEALRLSLQGAGGEEQLHEDALLDAILAGDNVIKAMRPPPAYKDRRFQGTMEDWERQLDESKTCYIGNLSFFTTEAQLWTLFSHFGLVEQIIMGLDRHTKTPCGFCFVVYQERAALEQAVTWLNGSMLDERPIRVDIDHGFQEGRQFGRGASGGQVRDEYRVDYDSGRGGYGKIMQYEMHTIQDAGQPGGPPPPPTMGGGLPDEPPATKKARAERFGT